MDIEFFFNDKVQKICQKYQESTKELLKQQQLIEYGIEPYTIDNAIIDNNYSPESGEPPFLGEYLGLDNSIKIIGNETLVSLCSVFEIYLKNFLSQNSIPLTKAKGNKGTLARHIKSLKEYGLNIPDGHVKTLEDLVLTRNNLIHDQHLFDVTAYNDNNENSIFNEKTGIIANRIKITHDNLTEVINVILDFSKNIKTQHDELIRQKKFR